MVAEMVIQPDFTAPRQHLHHAHEETWYVLDGELEFTSGAKVTRVRTGDWVLVPAGVPHTFANPGTVPTRFLATMTPDLYLGYFEELSAEVARTHRAGRDLTEEALAQISADLMAKYAAIGTVAARRI
jgi:uncharacterized cupin superfamily protein